VSSSLFCKLLLGCMLASSLSLKLMHGAASDVSQPDVISGQLATFLDRHGFGNQETIELARLAAVSGRSGDCRLVLVDVAPQGWHRNLLSRVVSPSDQLLFVFQGRTYSSQPVWQTWFHRYRSRVAAALGWDARSEMVYAVVASRNCDLTHIRWHELV
jgi:hypothetical protein